MLNLKRPKRLLLIALLLTVVMVFLPVAGVHAASAPFLLALGDSTGYGLSAFPDPANRDLATLHGFNDQFADALMARYPSLTYLNLAEPGDKTYDLLAKLQQAACRAQVKSARFVTVCIGGNNLLGPSLDAIFGLWGIDPDDYDAPDGSDMLSALAGVLAARFAADPTYDPMDDFARLLDLTDPAAIAFHRALLQGCADFQKEWPLIAGQIQNLNRTCEFFVTTVHNPLRVSGPADPLYPLYLEFEVLLASINGTIKAGELIWGYRVVDANKAIKNTPGGVDFNIPGAMAAAEAMLAMDPLDPLYSLAVNQFLRATDPHPTYCGHEAIYEQLAAVRRNTPSWYWWIR